MTTQATTGKGTLLKRAGTTIKEVTNLALNGAKAETIDVSNMDSGDYREFIAGFKDGGVITFSVNFLPGNAGHIGLEQDFKDGTLRTYTVVFTDADNTEMTGSAFVESRNINADVNSALTADYTLKVSGGMTMEGVV